MQSAIDRLWSSCWTIIAAAGVIFVFVCFGPLSPLLGTLGFVVIAGAALLVNRDAVPSGDSATLAPASQHGDEPLVLQSVIDALPDPVIAVTWKGDVAALNSQVRKIAPSLRPGEPLSLGLRRPALIAAVRRASATGHSQRVEFSERARADHWYEVAIIPAALSGSSLGKPTHLLLTFHDLTAHRRIEQMRADFVANASHELRTPLAALSGFIDTLRGSAQNDAAARERFLGIMQGQADRMARLIDDLLSLSRIELREHIIPDAPVEVLPIIRQIIDSLQPRAQERGVEMSVAGPAEPLIIRGDRDELIRLFENLVENAIKYGASGKRVELKLEAAPGVNGAEARISVRDYGPGIAAEHLPRLTERFYRVDVGQSRAEGGTGLGLALVKHILNRHEGRLNVESAPGVGSTFTVTMPLLRDAQQPAS